MTGTGRPLTRCNGRTISPAHVRMLRELTLRLGSRQRAWKAIPCSPETYAEMLTGGMTSRANAERIEGAIEREWGRE